MKEYIVGHISLHFSKAVCKFLQLPNSTVHCSVTGKCVNRAAGYGLEIPVTYTLCGPLRAIERVEKGVVREFIQTKDIKRKC